MQIYPAHICLGLPLLNSHQTIFVDCHSGLVCSIRLWVIFTLRTHASLIWATTSHEPKRDDYFRSNSVVSMSTPTQTPKPTTPLPAKPERPRWRPTHPIGQDRNLQSYCLGQQFYMPLSQKSSRQRGLHLGRFPHKPQILGTNGFALVPNTTEFLNAISFAVGNVALSLEIGSAYALQVVLIQIPCLVLYSIYQNFENVEQTFTLIFPRWDIIATLISIYLFTYIYAEGKSNYFKGVILILIYVVVLWVLV